MRVGDPDGYGRYGYLDTDADGRLICHDCGKAVKQLGSHACAAHGYASGAAYRERHGLARQAKLVAESMRQTMRERWAKDRDIHMAALEASRDIHAAQRKSVERMAESGWAPAVRKSKSARMQAKRGRALTADELEYLGDDMTMAEWCRRARIILADPSISAQSMSASLGLSPAAVHQRLRRYPDK